MLLRLIGPEVAKLIEIGVGLSVQSRFAESRKQKVWTKNVIEDTAYDFFRKTTAFILILCTFSRFGEMGFGESGFGESGGHRSISPAERLAITVRSVWDAESKKLRPQPTRRTTL